KATTRKERDGFVLNDAEILQLARWAASIEKHYGMPMDIEWAKDGITGKLYIVQARPETVHRGDKKISLKEYSLKAARTPLITGKSVGHKIVAGPVVIVKSLADAHKVKQGDILVADITN